MNTLKQRKQAHILGLATVAVTIDFARRKAKLDEIFQRIQEFNCS